MDDVVGSSTEEVVLREGRGRFLTGQAVGTALSLLVAVPFWSIALYMLWESLVAGRPAGGATIILYALLVPTAFAMTRLAVFIAQSRPAVMTDRRLILSMARGFHPFRRLLFSPSKRCTAGWEVSISEVTSVTFHPAAPKDRHDLAVSCKDGTRETFRLEDIDHEGTDSERLDWLKASIEGKGIPWIVERLERAGPSGPERSG